MINIYIARKPAAAIAAFIYACFKRAFFSRLKNREKCTYRRVHVPHATSVRPESARLNNFDNNTRVNCSYPFRQERSSVSFFIFFYVCIYIIAVYAIPIGGFSTNDYWKY